MHAEPLFLFCRLMRIRRVFRYFWPTWVRRARRLGSRWRNFHLLLLTPPLPSGPPRRHNCGAPPTDQRTVNARDDRRRHALPWRLPGSAADTRPGQCDRDRPALSPVARRARQPAPDDRATPFGRTGGSAGFMGQKWDSDIAGTAAARRPGADRSTSRTKPQHRTAPGSATRALPLRRPASCISLLIALAPRPAGFAPPDEAVRPWRRERL